MYESFLVGHEYRICFFNLSSDVKNAQIITEISMFINVNLIFINLVYYNCLLMKQLIKLQFYNNFTYLGMWIYAAKLLLLF
jgi:hypothetical protein